MGGLNWCVAGDCNEVRAFAERRGMGLSARSRKIEDFQSFVEESNLIDFSMVGRKYTWVRSNGTVMSRLDGSYCRKDGFLDGVICPNGVWQDACQIIVQ